ncbi:hypothetical protein Mapa_016549 [Marchantia paleacea]|nr:hypothetical protein Mapa_016549 [Marchantia paleacea]
MDTSATIIRGPVPSAQRLDRYRNADDGHGMLCALRTLVSGVTGPERDVHLQQRRSNRIIVLVLLNTE